MNMTSANPPPTLSELFAERVADPDMVGTLPYLTAYEMMAAVIASAEADGVDPVPCVDDAAQELVAATMRLLFAIVAVAHDNSEVI